MITSVVTASRQAIIRLTVRGPEGQVQAIDAVIDTGFDGTLTLSPALIATLGLVWHRRGRVLLADGSASLFEIYETIGICDGEPRRITVDEADIDPLVGMFLLYGYELIVQAIEGGAVMIQPLPQG
jgi:predicted aspartyl protease